MADAHEGGALALLEREVQLDAVERLLDRIVSRRGGGALGLFSPAGTGKTSLLGAARTAARARGVVVVSIDGLRGDDGQVASALTAALARPAEPAARCVVLLDDVHWADDDGLDLLGDLVAGAEPSGVAVLVAARPDADPRRQALLERVFGASAMRLLPLEPLSLQAVGGLLAAGAPGAAPGLAEEVRALSAGNPFLVGRLVAAVVEEVAGRRPVGGRIAGVVAPALGAWSALGLADTGPGPAAVGRAAAVLGDAGTVRRVALLTGAPEAAVAADADALSRVGLLVRGEPLRFAQPLVRDAIHATLPPSEAALAHERAALLLLDDGAQAHDVAGHLLLAPRRADPDVARRLAEAAGAALRAADAPEAVRMLERALDEPPPPAERAELLVALATAQAAAGEHAAGGTFDAALELLDEPVRRAEVQRAVGRWLFTTGRLREAARAFLLGRAELLDGEAAALDGELQAAYLGAALFDVELRPLVEREAVRSIDPAAEGATAAERSLLAQLAYRKTLAGAPLVQVRAYCDRAWRAGALLEDETADGTSWTLVAGSLYWTGHLERALEVVEEAGADAGRRGSRLALATVAWCAGPPRLHRGEVAQALACAEAALAARELGWGLHLGSLHRLHARCLMETGDLAGAAATLDEAFDLPALRYSSELAVLHEARGRLQLLAGDFHAALDEFDTCAELARRGPLTELPSALPWRSSAAVALHALGRRDEALARLEEELALAERSGVDRACSTALRVRGLVLGGEEGLGSLAAAVEAMAGSAPRLERTAAQLELGAALRRAKRRTDAERPLRSALAAAQAGGATALADRARTELAALGLRVRRGDRRDEDVLTASERRVALLAADGRTNKEIAAALVVSPKTVEFHLGQVYRKLQIRRRGELRVALATDAGQGRSSSAA